MEDFTDADPEAAKEDGLEEAEFMRLQGMSLEDILREGQKALFARLVGKARSGTASHQELAVLRNILKDNGMTLGIAPEQPVPEGPPADLPEFPDPDYS